MKDIIASLNIVADGLEDFGFIKEASVVDRMVKEAAGIEKIIVELKNLPTWAREMRPILKEVWYAVSRIKGNLHLAREASLIGASGMKALQVSEPARWRQIWEGLNVYRDALRDLEGLRTRLVEFLTHENEYIVNYAHTSISAINEVLAGKIDDMEAILANIRWH